MKAIAKVSLKISRHTYKRISSTDLHTTPRLLWGECGWFTQLGYNSLRIKTTHDLRAYSLELLNWSKTINVKFNTNDNA